MTDDSGVIKSNESLLWKGAPAKHFSADSVAAMAFTFLAASFTIYFACSLFQKGTRFGLIMAAILFIMALTWAVNAFILEPRKTATAVYYITDQRAVIASRNPGLEITSFDLKKLPPLKIERDKSGNGAIRFARPYKKFKDQAALFSLYLEGFEGIEDVDRVYMILESAARSRVPADKNE